MISLVTGSNTLQSLILVTLVVNCNAHCNNVEGADVEFVLIVIFIIFIIENPFNNFKPVIVFITRVPSSRSPGKTLVTPSPKLLFTR
jgi:hypothetical protein